LSIKENKAAIHRVFEEVTKGNLDIIDEFFADSFIRRAADGTEMGRDGYKQICGILVKAFPNFRVTIDDIVAEGDRAAFRFTWSGTMPGAAGNRLAVTEDYFCRFKNGKIIEFKNLLDQLAGHQARLEENKVLIRHAYALINKGGFEEFYELVSPGYVEHLTDRDMNLEQSKEFEANFLAQFPDINITINDMIAEGDKVAVLVTWRGVNKDTGKKIEMTNANIFKIAKGKIVEAWNVTDIRLAQQLGTAPK
jgi:predicted ester cyclase